MRQFEREKKGDAMLAYEYDSNFESRKWIKELPGFQFKPDWIVQIIPPFAGAIIRFRVKKKGLGREVSVYFDAYNNLAWASCLYWEIYPAAEESTARFALGEEDKMLEAIEASLEKVQGGDDETPGNREGV